MKLNFGVAFVTGRAHFRNVLKTYFNNWIEHDLINNRNINLHLFVVYDLNYADAIREDFRNIPPEVESLLASVNLYGRREIDDERQRLIDEGRISVAQGDLLFGEGYAKKRNAALYFASKKKMDRLLFIDDDEYPVAVAKNPSGRLAWMGQSIVRTHLKYGANADITNGHHCGYISPIPYLTFNRHLTEDDFRQFIEAISNDIVSWSRVKNTTLENRGITYAASDVIENAWHSPVQEVNGMKFISGANLCFNLARLKRIPAFYNPPGARGEDAFMSTTLRSHRVVRVPCYTFHDAFGEYQHLLQGVLPHDLRGVDRRSKSVVNRFLRGAIGWVRYKPLLTYVTQRERYSAVIDEAMRKLDVVVPKLSEYFGTSEFETIEAEFRKYHSRVREHFDDFEATKRAWAHLVGVGRTRVTAQVG